MNQQPLFKMLFVWVDGTWDTNRNIPMPDDPIYELRVPATLTDEQLEEITTLALKRLRLDVLQRLIANWFF